MFRPSLFAHLGQKNQVSVRKKICHPKLVLGSVTNKVPSLPETKGATYGAKLSCKKNSSTSCDHQILSNQAS